MEGELRGGGSGGVSTPEGGALRGVGWGGLAWGEAVGEGAVGGGSIDGASLMLIVVSAGPAAKVRRSFVNDLPVMRRMD